MSADPIRDLVLDVLEGGPDYYPVVAGFVRDAHDEVDHLEAENAVLRAEIAVLWAEIVRVRTRALRLRYALVGVCLAVLAAIGAGVAP